MYKLINTLIAVGFEKKGHGLKLVTTNNTHWVSIIGDKIQNYAYFSEDSEFEKIYDSGLITVTDVNTGKVIDLICLLLDSND